MRTTFLCLVCLVPTLIAAPLPKAKAPENKRVRELFTKMREGTYRENTFPTLDQSDIPALLELADSTETLKSFPTNPRSSRALFSCTEGVAALWLIEGIRVGGKFPSLNPQLVGVDSVFQPAAARAYRAWWEKVKDRPLSESKSVLPFDGDLWY